jgi:hypothetical protein
MIETTTLKVNFFKDGRFKVEGFIDISPSKYKLKSLFEIIVKKAGDIKEVYTKTISNDGKIVGNERSMIISEIDTFFKLLMMFRVYLNSSVEDYEALYEINNKVEIEFFASRFKCSGFIKSEESEVSRTFGSWYDKIMIEQLKMLVHSYKTACEDGIITVDELKSLNILLDEILYQLVVIRYQVEYMVISK